jgi:hypothetical protein
VPVGLPVTKGDVNNTFTTVVRQLFNTFLIVEQFQAYLAATPDGDLTSLGFTSGEVAQIKSAVNDADQLRQVWEGTATRSPAYDYRTFTKLGLGTGLF